MKTEKIRPTQRTWCKVLAFLLAVLTALAAAGGGTLFVWMATEDFYTRSPDRLTAQALENAAAQDAEQALYFVLAQSPEGVLNGLSENVVGLRASGTGVPGGAWAWGETGGLEISVPLRAEKQHDGQEDRNRVFRDADTPNAVVTVSLAQPLPVLDRYWLATEGVPLACRWRYRIPVLTLAALLLSVLCTVFLLCAAGHRREDRDLHPGWGTKVPLEPLLAIFVLAIWGMGVLEWLLISELPGMWPLKLAALLTLGAVGWSLTLGLLISVALRIKCKCFWRTTLLYWIGRGLFLAARWFARLLLRLPLVWKTMLIFSAASLLEFFLFLLWGEGGDVLLWWLFKKIVELPVVLYVAVSLQRLRKAGRRMAEGDFAPVNTQGLIWDMKKHGEDLNSLSAGMQRALEARLRSERMKTELITNVSHDIKTPLTSIINYADLIAREPCDNERIREYTEVLQRQSERLKRLIEDLVEASKASTGNIEMQMAPLELGVLLTQAVGEYQSRLSDAGLTLVEPAGTSPVYIMADGRRLWRVLDNLLDNVRKYAQPGTRVFLDLTSDGHTAQISLRNTSREMLNVTPAELLERFTRGDAARHTEGSGLGLSIANSLTQLMGGTLLLGVDGDLFKVLLRFPVIAPPQEPVT